MEMGSDEGMNEKDQVVGTREREREMVDDEGMKAGWVTEEETEVGKQRRYGEENLGWKMKKDAEVRNEVKKDAEVRNDARTEARKGNHQT